MRTERSGFANFRATVVESLKGYSDAELDIATEDAGIFLDRRWFRLLESLPVPALLGGGEVTLRFVVVDAGGAGGQGLTAVCPFLVTRSRDVVSYYSLENRFFESRLFTTLYKKLAWSLGAGSEGSVLATIPFSWRSGVACRHLPPNERRAVHHAAIEKLEAVARQERLPLWFNAVDKDSPLGEVLRERGFSQVYYAFDTFIDTGVKDFAELLGRFDRTIRRQYGKDRRWGKLGYRFEVIRDFEALASRFEAFYEATSSKYGGDHFHFPAALGLALARHLGEHAEAVVATKDGAPVGFCMLLRKGEEMFSYRIGRQPGPDGEEPPVYFHLLTYEPLQHAVRHGVRRVWLGPGSWETKRRRGAGYKIFHSYYRYPTLRSRVVLGSFISLFSRRAKL